MTDENPEPRTEYQPREDWPPESLTFRGCVRNILMVLGIIAVIIGIFFAGCAIYLHTALRH